MTGGETQPQCSDRITDKSTPPDDGAVRDRIGDGRRAPEETRCNQVPSP